MENNVNQTAATEAKCCVDYCTQNFTVAGKEIQNSYLCGQTPLSTSELWKIQKQKRTFASKVVN
jgi:hypothetical protein